MLFRFRYSVAASRFKRRITTQQQRKFETHSPQSPKPNPTRLQPFSIPGFTMAPKELNFITGNKNKLAEVQAILSATPVKLQSQALDLLEIQGTIEEVSTDKCRRAAEAVRTRSLSHLVGLFLSLISQSVGARTSPSRRYMSRIQSFQ
jgi:hypothetical protein